jgi:antitoxin component YwqK of YwqJK toxin-antitoxin module
MRYYIYWTLFFPIISFAQKDIQKYVEQHLDSSNSVHWLSNWQGPLYLILDSNDYIIASRQYNEDGIILSQSYILDSLSIGLVYDSTGLNLTSFSIRSCVDSIGLEYDFFPNGKLYAIQQGIGHQYQNGCRRRYNEDGRLQFLSHYAKGRRYGITMSYGQNGNLESASYLDWQGGENGDEVTYHENQNFESIVEVSNGKANGRVYLFDENGELISISLQANNEFVEWVYKRN